MSISLVQKLQEKLGYPPLKKIDANTGHIVESNRGPSEERFSQVVIPTILSALYRYTRTDEGADMVLHSISWQNWCNLIFDDKKEEVLEKLAAYSYYKTEDIEPEVNKITQSAIDLVKEKLPLHTKILDLKNLLADSLNDTLLYLPPTMRIGKSLHDNTMDDNIHKMEGPISSMANTIGSFFSKSESDEKDILTGKKMENK